MNKDESLIEVCTDISAPASCISKKRYEIAQEKFEQAYQLATEQGGSYAAVAAELSCSVHYVRRTAKKYGLQQLGQHGGARANSGGARANSGGRRAGAGRPKGSKNSEAIDRKSPNETTA